MKKDFISYVSHELKAPLASMQETTQLLLERIPGSLTEKQNRLLQLNLQSGSSCCLGRRRSRSPYGRRPENPKIRHPKI